MNYKTKNILILLIISLLGSLHAQYPSNFEILVGRTDSILKNNNEGALKWIERELATQETKKETYFEAYLNDKKADLLRTKGFYDESIITLEKNLKLKEKLENSKFLSETYTLIGKTYANKGDYEKSIAAFLNALTLLEKISEKKGIAFGLNNIAVVYDLQKNYFKAMQYYQKSIAIKLQLKDSSGLAAGYNNLAITFFNLRDIDRSIEFHKKALALNESLKREEPLARSLNNLGFALYEKKEMDNALNYLMRAYAMRLKFENQKDIATTQNNLSLVWLSKGNIDSADLYNRKVLIAAKKINAFNLLKDAYSAKAEIESSKKNYKNAGYYKDSLIMYKDSLINENNIQSVAEMEARYEYEKMKRDISEKSLDIAIKEKSIKDTKLKMSYWIIWSLILILLLSVSIIILYSTKKKKSIVTAQKLLIEKQNDDLNKINRLVSEKLDKTALSLDQKNSMLDLFYKEQTQTDLPPELLNLSKREVEVLSYLALGWSDQEIADALFLSKATVKTHLRRIYSKLLVKGRAEAVSIAHKYKIIGISEIEKK